VSWQGSVGRFKNRNNTISRIPKEAVKPANDQYNVEASAMATDTKVITALLFVTVFLVAGFFVIEALPISQ
jgi:hypothetical protein